MRYIYGSGVIFRGRFGRLGSLDGNRFRSSWPDLCKNDLGARAQQVKRVVYSIFTVFPSSVLWTWIQLTVKWIGILLLPFPLP